jgi:GNAT superfamily N-acetyltransferase
LTDRASGAPPSDPPADIVELDLGAYRPAIPGLAALTLDVVDGGASVNFLADLTLAEAAAWWEARTDSVAKGLTTAFVALSAGRVVGCVLLIRATQPNAPHRAEIAKVLVHRDARRQGLGRALMLAAESRARADGRWLLILDTVTGSPADGFYRSLGWHVAGHIPNFALEPDGRIVSTTYFWKDLR